MHFISLIKGSFFVIGLGYTLHCNIIFMPNIFKSTCGRWISRSCNSLMSVLFSCRNAEKIIGYLNSNVLSQDLIPPHVNFSHLSTSDYAEMYGVIKIVKEDSFAQLGLEPCLLEDELNKAGVGPMS